jgi:hypothetical protein
MNGLRRSTMASWAACLLAGCSANQPTPEAGLPNLSAHRWKHRVLIIDTPSPDAAEYRQQRADLEAAPAGLKERDLFIITQVGPNFRVRLVGKDGGVKLDQPRPVEVPALFALIDAMPMRRAEMSGR